MQHYFFGERFDWINTTDEEIIKICEKTDFTKTIESQGKDICYLGRNIVLTSKDVNYLYKASVYSLNSPSSLESSSIYEVIIQDDEEFCIHNISVLRNGEIIDKLASSVIRVFDNESGSNNGIISKEKKINILLNDLYLEDILIIETTNISKINEKKIFYNKYFGYYYTLPTGYWNYKLKELIFINKRSEDIVINFKFLRDENGEIINKDPVVISSGETYTFLKENYNLEANPDLITPSIEISTKTTWEDIGKDIYKLYEPFLKELIDFSSIPNFLLPTDSKEKQIRYIIEYVQNNINYLYDAEFMHGHIPQSCEKTIIKKSGDCKAKSLLLVCLLNKIGVKADIIFVNYSGDYNFSIYYPSPFLFSHAIVKIDYNGDQYFVDPTYKNSFGDLKNRVQPIFEYYLPISENSSLQKRELTTPKDFLYNENYLIDLSKDYFESKVEFYNNFADEQRLKILFNSNEEVINLEKKYIIPSFCLGTENNNDIFLSQNYEKIFDDIDKNILNMKFTAKLGNVYSGKDKEIFKFYPYDIPQIDYSNKDINIFYKVSPFKRIITLISPSKIIKEKGDVTSKSIMINNKFFTFSNKKKFIGKRKVIVETEFKPKFIGRIGYEDLRVLKSEIDKINDSNNGIGIVIDRNIFFNKWKKYVINIFGVLLVLYIIQAIAFYIVMFNQGALK